MSHSRKHGFDVLHVFNKQKKFSIGYFKFLADNGVDLSRHFLFHYGRATDEFQEVGVECVFASFFSPFKGLRLLALMIRAERIIIHSLASPWLLLFLFLVPGLARKTFWVIWGKDLYYFRTLERKRFYDYIYEFFRRRVFRKVGYVVVNLREEYDLAKEWYGVSGKCIECNMLYPYAVDLAPGAVESERADEAAPRVIVGNSASETNNHVAVFSLLQPHLDEISEVVCPLSYGGPDDYRDLVLREGTRLLGDKFRPLTGFMDLEAYLALLKSVRFAIYGYERQEGLGNIITLLRYGATLYIVPGNSTWRFFLRKGIVVRDLNELKEGKPAALDTQTLVENSRLTGEIFSEQTSIRTWKQIFEIPVGKT